MSEVSHLSSPKRSLRRERRSRWHWRCGYWPAKMVAVFGALLYIGPPQAAEDVGEAARCTPITFMAGSEGTLPAWLVAGPFAQPDAAVENKTSLAKPAYEGEPTAGLQTPVWVYLNAGEQQVEVASPPGPSPAYFYADCDLMPLAAAEAYLLLVSSTPSCLWLDSELLIQTSLVEEKHSGIARLPHKEGARRCRVRLETVDGRGSFYLVAAAPAKEKDGRLLPQRLFDQRLLLRDLTVERRQRLWADGIRLAVSPRFVDEAKRVILTLRPAAGCPRGEGELHAVFYPAADGEWPRAEAGPVAPGLWQSEGLKVELEAPTVVAWDLLEIVGALRSEGKTIVEVRAALLCEANLDKWLENFGSRLRQEIGMGGLRLPPAYHAASAALAMLRWEQIGILRESRGYRSSSYAERLIAMRDEAEAAWQAARANRDLRAGAAGLVEAAYLSPIDGSAQPYFFYRPRRAAVAEPLPLVVLLHGYVPSYNKLRWMSIDSALQEVCEALAISLLLPFGRGNTDFLSIGEEDVLQAIAEASERWRVDLERLYLAGYSMGGSGVWTLLSHYPDRFAAALIWSGRNDYFYWHEGEYRDAGVNRDTIPAWKRFLILVDNPYDLVDNLRHIPLRVVHPPDDSLVQPGQSSRIFEKLKPPLGRMEFIVPPAGDDHWYFCREVRKAEPYRWLLQHRRRVAEEIEHIALTPKYGKRDWLAIRRLREWGKPGRVKAKIDRPRQRIVIAEEENVAALGIDIAAFAPTGEEWHIARGERSARLKAATAAQTTADEVIIDPASLALLPAAAIFGEEGKIPPKNHALCGPMKEALNQPFLLVIGTAGDDEEDRKNRANAEIFVRDWKTFAHAEAPRKDDSAVTREEIDSRNLVLFGSPTTNLILGRIADRLPFRFLPNGYGVGDAKIEGEGLGFCAIYPNPEAPGRCVVIIAGRYYGESLPFNHKWDLVPDYIVFGEANDAYDGTPTALLGGHFDAAWQYDPRLAAFASH